MFAFTTDTLPCKVLYHHIWKATQSDPVHAQRPKTSLEDAGTDRTVFQEISQGEMLSKWHKKLLDIQRLEMGHKQNKNI